MRIRVLLVNGIVFDEFFSIEGADTGKVFCVL